MIILVPDKFWNTCNKLSILILFFVTCQTTNRLLIPEYNTLLAEFNVTGLALCTTTLHPSLVPTIFVFRLKLTEINIIHSRPLKLSP